MRIIYTVLFVFLINTVYSQKFITTHGRDIVTQDGKPFLLRGVNLGFLLEPEGYPFEFAGRIPIRQFFDVVAELIGPDDARKFWEQYQKSFITRKEIAYIKSLGLNSVRIPFDYRNFVNEQFLGAREPRGYQLLDSVINWCKKEGIYAILDMHAAPGGQAGWTTDDGYVYPWLFEENGEDSRKLTIDIWTKIAKRYSNNTSVIGYDLLGEPIHQYFDSARFNKLLEPFYKRLAVEIRKVDQNHLFFLAGSYWNRNFDVFSTPFDSKLVYTTHLYSFTDPYSSLDYFVNFSKKYNVPVWLGEFGEHDVLFVDSLRRMCERNKIGWCLWPIKKMNNNHTLLKMNKPENWDLITGFTNGIYNTHEEKVLAYPGYKISKKAMEDFLENTKFDKCIKSDYYLKALGIK